MVSSFDQRKKELIETFKFEIKTMTYIFESLDIDKKYFNGLIDIAHKKRFW